MRIRVGERVLLTDGSGAGAECEVVAADKAALQCAVRLRRQEHPPELHLTVAQAIPKGEHADRAVDLLTEVGVHRIVPWAAGRNVVQWRGEDKATRGAARWRTVAAAAAKQSRRLRFPDVTDICSTEQLAALAEEVRVSYVLHESAAVSLAPLADGLVLAERPAPLEVLLVVGPEGGVTDEELGRLTTVGAQAVRLGPTVLRSSSAGVVAASILLSRTATWR